MERYGKPAVRRLAELGVLDAHAVLEHFVWITDDEIDVFAESGSREFLFDRYRLSVPRIVEVAWAALGLSEPLPFIPHVPATPGTYAPV